MPLCYGHGIMKFIVTNPESIKAAPFEIVDIDPLMVGPEGAKVALTHKFAAAWQTRVLVRSYPEVAADIKSSNAEMAAAAEIFLKRA